MKDSVDTVHQSKRRVMSDPWPRLIDWLDSWTSGDSSRPSRHDRMLRMEQTQRDGQLILRLEIPGVDPDEDIDVTLHDEALIIDAHREERHEEGACSEFRYGRLQRCIALPRGVSEDGVSASYVDGILEIEVTLPPDNGDESRSRHIAIRS